MSCRNACVLGPRCQARFKYPPHWVSTETMFEAMTYLDSVTEKCATVGHEATMLPTPAHARVLDLNRLPLTAARRSRGYVVLSKSELAPLLLFRLLSPRSPTGEPVGESVRTLLRSIAQWPAQARRGCMDRLSSTQQI